MRRTQRSRSGAADFQRLFGSMELLYAVAGAMLCATLGTPIVWPVLTGAEQVTPEPDLTLFVCQDALTNSVLMAALPVLAALPFGAAAFDDLHSRYIRSALPRTDRQTYTASKLLVTAVSGALVAALGAVGTIVIIALAFPSAESPEPDPAQMPSAVLTSEVLMLCLLGAMWAVLGGALALLMDSRVMTFAGPFLVYYLLVIMVSRYLPQLTLLDPDTWISTGQSDLAGQAAGRWWVPAELFAVFCGTYYLAVESRTERA